MSEEARKGPESEFPREAYLRLLRDAQPLFDAKNRRDALVSGLALDELSGAGAKPVESWIDALADPAQLETALKLARRIASELGAGDRQSLLTTLEALYVRQRTAAVDSSSGPQSNDKQWVGFDCVHYYSLGDRFFGRAAELADLNEWLTTNAGSISVRCLCALGGGGKSALAWTWSPLAHAMTSLGIALDTFRGAYEKSAYKSILIVFHSLYAESIVRPDALNPVASLDEAARQEWLSGTEIVEQVAHFLSSEQAKRVALTFEFHSLDKMGITAFLADDKRRIAWDASPVAKAWWERIEGACPPLAMLVLAESVFLAGSRLQELVDAIATGTPRGIEYAFAALRLKRAIAEVTIDMISDTESWTEVQIFLRLEDVKQKLGWRDASKGARELWTSLERDESHRLAYVLRIAEELAIRRATVEDYHRGFLFTAPRTCRRTWRMSSMRA